MNYRNIVLSDKALFDEHFLKNGYNSAAGSFAYWYAWGRDGKMKIDADDTALYIAMADGTLFAPFLRDFSASAAPAVERLRREGIREIIYVPKRVMEKIREDCGESAVSFVPSREYDEYVYSAHDLIELNGKKYHGKRNKINAYLREHEVVYRTGTQADREALRGVTLHWALENEIDDADRDEELAAMDVMLDHPELGVKWCVLEQEGEVKAFSVGSSVNARTVCIHFEKCLPCCRDLYAYINREFLRHEWSDRELVNREEDLGLEGLRRAKLSYHPLYMEQFFIGTIL